MFEHSPIVADKHIRLIKFRLTSNQVSCELDVHELKCAPLYYGLSYYWGPQTELQVIKCNGQDLPVSEGLYEALHYLKEFAQNNDDNIEYFWIDQICINQTNLAERGSQVLLMRDIFAHAQRTVIWLGTYVPHRDGAIFEVFERIDADRRSYEVTRSQKEGKPGQIAFEVASTLKLEDEDWIALVSFAQRPWFKRVWIMQEAALSRQDPLMLCSARTLLWSTFARCVSWLAAGYYSTIRLFQDSFATSPLWIIEAFRNTGNPKTGMPRLWTLTAILVTTIAQSTDPLDHIYALLGFVSNEEHPSHIVPDYQRDASELFADISWRCIKETGHLQILASGGAKPVPQTTTIQFPSWVPRWDILIDNQNLENLQKSWSLYTDAAGFVDVKCVEDYCATLDRKARIGETADKRDLALSGVCIDKIAWSAKAYSVDAMAVKGAHVQIWREALQHVGINSLSSNVQRATMDAFTRTFYETINWPYPYETWNDACQRASVKDFYAHVASLRDHFDDDPAIVRACEELGQGGDGRNTSFGTGGRRIFVTVQGHVGHGPPALQLGDKIWALYGGDVPFVLRELNQADRDANRMQEGDCRHALVGTACLAGFMNGKAIRMLEEGILKEETVVLR